MVSADSSLQGWQQRLADAIESAGDHVSSDGMSRHSALTTQQGLRVYRDSSRYARLAVLQQTYPVLMQLLGETCFDGIAMDYVIGSVSGKSDLNVYGESFSGWIETTLPGLPGFEQLPWLADMARLEWAIHESPYRRVRPDCGDIGDDPSLRLHDDIHLFASDWPVHHVWSLHQPGLEPAEVDMDGHGCWLVIEQRQGTVKLTEIDESLWNMMYLVQPQISLKQLLSTDVGPVNRLSELVMKQWLCMEPPV